MIGSGCRAVLAEEIVRDECLPGVWTARFDESVGLVEVCYAPDRLEAEEIVEKLDSIGCPTGDPNEVDGKASQQPPKKEVNT